MAATLRERVCVVYLRLACRRGADRVSGARVANGLQIHWPRIDRSLQRCLVRSEWAEIVATGGKPSADGRHQRVRQ